MGLSLDPIKFVSMPPSSFLRNTSYIYKEIFTTALGLHVKTILITSLLVDRPHFLGYSLHI